MIVLFRCPVNHLAVKPYADLSRKSYNPEGKDRASNISLLLMRGLSFQACVKGSILLPYGVNILVPKYTRIQLDFFVCISIPVTMYSNTISYLINTKSWIGQFLLHAVLGKVNPKLLLRCCTIDDTHILRSLSPTT